MKETNSVKITRTNLVFIIGNEIIEIENLAKFNSYCFKCRLEKKQPEMIDFQMWLNDLNDLIFKGICKNCKSKIARYIELGARKEFLMKTQYIKEKNRRTLL